MRPTRTRTRTRTRTLTLTLALTLTLTLTPTRTPTRDPERRRIVERAEKRAQALEDKAMGFVRPKPPPTLMEKWKARCDLPEALVRRATLHRLVENKIFKTFFLVLIFGNTILVAMFSPYRSGMVEQAYDIAGYTFAGFFYLEMFLKIGGEGLA